MDSSKIPPSFSSTPGGYVSSFPKFIPKKQQNNKTISVLVEGNIGAGKSTFLDYFLKFQDMVEIIPEPVDQWRNYCGVNLLVCFFFSLPFWD